MSIDEKYEEAKFQANFFKRKGLSYLDPRKYKLNLTTLSRFETLMKIYAIINPSWVNDTNMVENRKPKNVRNPINLYSKNSGYPRRKTNQELTGEIIKGVLGSGNLIEIAMSIHVANRIAHECENARNNIMATNLPEDLAYFIPRKGTEKKIFYEYLDEYLQNVEQPSKVALRYLGRYGLTENMLKEIVAIDGENLLVLSRARDNAFIIKDDQIYELIEYLNHNSKGDEEAIIDSVPSYGLYSTEKRDFSGNIIYQKDTGKPVMENRLIVDIPYYGQCCVHVLEERSISALSQTPYDGLHRFHEKESVILTDDISPKAKEFLDSRKESGKSIFLDEDMLTELRKLREKDARFAHYLATKLGAEKDDIDFIYSDDKGEER